MVPAAGSRPRRAGGDAEREGEDAGVEAEEDDSALGEGDRGAGGGGAADLRGFLAGAGRVSLARDLRFGAGREGSGDGSSGTGDGSGTDCSGGRGAYILGYVTSGVYGSRLPWPPASYLRHRGHNRIDRTTGLPQTRWPTLGNRFLNKPPLQESKKYLDTRPRRRRRGKWSRRRHGHPRTRPPLNRYHQCQPICTTYILAVSLPTAVFYSGVFVRVSAV